VAGLALALVAGLSLSGCAYEAAGDPAGPGPATLPRPTRAPGGAILALGDSLLVGAVEHGGLEETLARDGWRLEVVAERGRTVPWALQQVEARRRPVPRTVLVVLGTNPGAGVAGFQDEVELFLEALRSRGARRILWIPPHREGDRRYREKVEILEGLAGEGLAVPDWGAVLDRHPEWVGGDGIHLTEEGYRALAAFIRHELTRLD
jgi:lysophospholipase L1-like esterase